MLGAALGLVLYHAAFGFTSAWRVFIADRRGEGLRAQMVMLAIASILFFPVLASGTLFGQPVAGNVSPAGIGVVFGAFIFGIGMQLGGGCASGTLYTVGGGSHAHGDHARRLHRRLRHRRRASALVDGAAEPARHLDHQDLGSLDGAGGAARRLRR